jgi:hypothetical protein
VLPVPDIFHCAVSNDHLIRLARRIRLGYLHGFSVANRKPDGASWLSSGISTKAVSLTSLEFLFLFDPLTNLKAENKILFDLKSSEL